LSRTVYLNENLRDIAIFEALAGAGLRVSEVLDLQVGDLVIRERDTHDNFSYITVREGKGSKRRTVPMSKAVKSAFSNYIKIHLSPASWVRQFFVTPSRPAMQMLILLPTGKQKPLHRFGLVGRGR
jgi:site-specific recombinase XerD